ncbi:hypothetical protein KCG44_12900 [Pacificimonas sp. WHA3]|uniref:TraB/GumN family protein n=1 Tax=Pacificimonas pallii TaxID=2827236 RepID=A0ABS6SH03_9SPHN|nr:DUF5694 domain-containing protein [Pacificimonas pallii]MBV7257684.1 hypothetical protein [Pacificimonas pallii]
MKMFLAAMAALVLAFPVAAQETPDVEVMVFGTYHFANPGLDVVNIEVDDVTTPSRQAELARLGAALAGWKPDRVLVETQIAPPFEVSDYADFTPAQLSERRNETVQIGYRLAHMLGHEAVYGFDEQPSDDEPDYFPFAALTAYADANGMTPVLDTKIADAQAFAAAEGEKQKTQSIATSLLPHNDSGKIAEKHSNFYFGVLQIGDADTQPGADLNAMWFLRNAKMFAKIGLIAEPGERIFVLVGSGHKYWLDTLVRDTPGFRLVDATPYLKLAE